MNSRKTRILKKILSVDLSLVFSFQSFDVWEMKNCLSFVAKDFSSLSLDV